LASNKNGGKLITFDNGLAYLLTNKLQLAVTLARGLNKNSPDLAWTFGLSAKY